MIDDDVITADADCRQVEPEAIDDGTLAVDGTAGVLPSRHRFRFRSGDSSYDSASVKLLMTSSPESVTPMSASDRPNAADCVVASAAESAATAKRSIATVTEAVSMTTGPRSMTPAAMDVSGVKPVSSFPRIASASGVGAKFTAGRPSNSMSRAQDRMLTRVMVTVFVGYVLCFGLYFAVNCVDPTAHRLPTWAHKTAAWLVYAHCCANPVLYGLTNRQFWCDFVTLVRRLKNNIFRQ